MMPTAWFAALAGVVLYLFAGPAAAVQQAFLVQNSGWMEPFYADPQSQFKPLIAAVANAAARPGDKVMVLAFSQSSGSNVSPRLLGEGNGAAAVAGWLAPLEPARKSGTALADTDFREAVTRTIGETFKSRPGIIWIFTNNKNSPGNDPATATRNLEFYRLLHLEPSITRTVVFPLRMPVQGKFFAAKGLMVYGLAYGKEAGDELGRMVAEGRLAKILTKPPARLKPVDQDGVRIVPEAVLNTPNVTASMGADKRTVVLDVDADKLVPHIRLKASLQNLFYPYLIAGASVDGQLRTRAGTTPLTVAPTAVTNLAPGASQSIDVSFKLPLEEVPSAWSRQAIAAMGKQVIMPMSVGLGLSNQRLALPASFKTEMQDLFPGDPLSDVFVPPDSVRSSTAQVPLIVRVQYPLTPVLVMVGGVLALLLALAAFGLLAMKSTRYPIVVNGVRRNVVLKPFKSLAIQSDDGVAVGEIRRGLGRPAVVKVESGQTLTIAS
ncbi:hypothetical protein AB2N08_15455 [Massilia aurea]|uniref:hypothetical protein n=1 Tax=Massilia aurea TaxID=373040 RepID=UPI0034632D04